MLKCSGNEKRAAWAGLVMAITLLAVGTGQALAQYRYTLTNLGVLSGGTESYAYGINNLGQVVGESLDSYYGSQAFLYDGTMHALPGGRTSTAIAINDSGEIVGGATNYQLYFGMACRLGLSGMQWIQPPGDYGSASAVNSAGKVAITTWSHTDNPYHDYNYHAFVYDGSGFQDIGTLLGAGDSHANAINDQGAVAGSYVSHAYVFSNGQVTYIPVGGTSSSANGINNSGTVAGSYTTSDQRHHAFVYSQGQVQNLGDPGVNCGAVGINSLGQIIGYAGTTYYPCIFENGVIVNLNDLIDPANQFTLMAAEAINDSGQIVGFGKDSQNQTRGFLLTPTPEPATLSLLVLGGLAMLRRRKW